MRFVSSTNFLRTSAISPTTHQCNGLFFMIANGKQRYTLGYQMQARINKNNILGDAEEGPNSLDDPFFIISKNNNKRQKRNKIRHKNNDMPCAKY